MSIGEVTAGVTGNSGENLPESIVAKIGKAATKLDELATEMAAAKDTDTARWQTLNDERKAEAIVLTDLKKAHEKATIDAETAEAQQAAKDIVAFAAGLREPSKARLVGGSGFAPSMSGYEKGAFIYNLMRKDDPSLFDDEKREIYGKLAQIAGHFLKPSEETKGTLGVSGVRGLGETSTGAFRDAMEAAGGYNIPQDAIDAHVKATLGLTAATGAFIMPNAVVGDLVKPGRYRSAVTQLVSATRGVSTQLAQIPVRTTAPTRAAVVPWGDAKTNVNLAYGGYTATMYTLAIIYDLAKQFVRFSAGAAEQDVLQELAHSFELGEAYYELQGSGTGEPYGIQTAIATAFGAYTSSFSPSATTLAGSIGVALATAAGGLAVRNRNPEGALLGPLAYWTMLAQGTDSAGFFFAPAGGPTQIRPGTLISPFGIPVYPESQLAGTDDLLVGEFSAVKVYFGEAYRVDTSDVAGDRWDKNLVGFRGEEEMGLDARPAVYAGAFQFIADVLP